MNRIKCNRRRHVDRHIQATRATCLITFQKSVCLIPMRIQIDEWFNCCWTTQGNNVLHCVMQKEEDCIHNPQVYCRDGIHKKTVVWTSPKSVFVLRNKYLENWHSAARPIYSGYDGILFTHFPLVPHMRQRIESALVQIIACRLIGANPLSKPMLVYCQLDP